MKEFLCVITALLLALLVVDIYASPCPDAGCNAGDFLNAATNSCAQCPAGYRYVFPIAITADTSSCAGGAAAAAPCAAGTFSNAVGATNPSVCSVCYHLETLFILQSCPSGTYSLGGASSCTPCSAGYACPSGTADKEVQHSDSKIITHHSDFLPIRHIFSW